MADNSPIVGVQVANVSASGKADDFPQSQPEAEPTVEHDQSYYFEEDPMAIFLVENRLFKIHRYFLSEGSEVFRGMFASPIEGTSPEGVTDDRPISLSGVTAKEFRALLDHFYLPLHRGWKFASREDELQVYLDLLSISHRFLFDGVFHFAVEKLQPMLENIPAIQRFVLGVKYDLREWLHSAYESLLDSATTPAAHELEILGFDKTARLMQARDAMHQQHLKAGCVCRREVPSSPGKSPKSKSSHSIVTLAQAVKPSSRTFVQQYFE